MTATTDREWIDWYIENQVEAFGDLDSADRLRTIAATLPPPYSPQPPTVEGWYWWRWKPDAPWAIMQCVKDADGHGIYFWDNTKWTPLRGVNGEWSGPIPQPPK